MKRIVNNYDVICFDVDSTLVTIEGIDFLAEKRGIGNKVKELTSLSMEGHVLIDEVFGKKIDLVAPNKDDMSLLSEYYCSKLTLGAETVVHTLHERGVEVWLVSGSFKPALKGLAKLLHIPEERIHANDIYFNPDGSYKGINDQSSLTKASGKARCATTISKGRRVAFIGDSVTDLATQPVVTSFIGFGGVTVRQKVKNEANFFIKTESLKPLLWLMQ